MSEDYILDKQKKVSFSKVGKTPKSEKLELVHTDVWGSTLINSIGGSLYYITIIDNLTRKVWVYFIKKKSKVYDVFKKWKVMVGNETGLKVKCMRSDNEKEYTDRRFRDFCTNSEIKMKKTILKTPQ